MDKLKEILERYDVKIVKAGSDYVILFDFSQYYGRFIQKRFVGKTLEETVEKAWKYFKENQNAGYYIG